MWCAQSFGFGINAGDLTLISVHVKQDCEKGQPHQQYVCGIFILSIMAGLPIKLMGSKLRTSLRNLLIKSPNPCHVSISTRIYDMKLVIVASALEV